MYENKKNIHLFLSFLERVLAFDWSVDSLFAFPIVGFWHISELLLNWLAINVCEAEGLSGWCGETSPFCGVPPAWGIPNCVHAWSLDSLDWFFDSIKSVQEGWVWLREGEVEHLAIVAFVLDQLPIPRAISKENHLDVWVDEGETFGSGRKRSLTSSFSLDYL